MIHLLLSSESFRFAENIQGVAAGCASDNYQCFQEHSDKIDLMVPIWPGHCMIPKPLCDTRFGLRRPPWTVGWTESRCALGRAFQAFLTHPKGVHIPVRGLHIPYYLLLDKG